LHDYYPQRRKMERVTVAGRWETHPRPTHPGYVATSCPRQATSKTAGKNACMSAINTIIY